MLLLAPLEVEVLPPLLAKKIHAAYWQTEQEKKIIFLTQNAFDISMFLICGSTENINSAVLQTKENLASIFFPLQCKIFVCYTKQ